MTLEVRFEREASRELDEAALRYEEERAGLGLEFLIDWLVEDEIKITQEQFEKFETAMNAMGMGDPERVNCLKNCHDSSEASGAFGSLKPGV